MNELIRRYGFRVGAVAEAIGVGKNTISSWGENAPIGKLYKVSAFTHIPMSEVIECFKPQPDPTDTAATQPNQKGGD